MRVGEKPEKMVKDKRLPTVQSNALMNYFASKE
jgi:hypothetical protein